MTSNAQQILDNFDKLSTAEQDAVVKALSAINEPKPPELHIEISGPAGSGKTALGEQLAGLLAQEGHDVFYYEGDDHGAPQDLQWHGSPREGRFIPLVKRKIVIRTKHD